MKLVNGNKVITTIEHYEWSEDNHYYYGQGEDGNDYFFFWDIEGQFALSYCRA